MKFILHNKVYKTTTMQRILLFVFATFTFAACQDIDGCPLYGCRPSGSFSFQQRISRTNASVHWISKDFIGPVPNALGCVGNSVLLVCQSNGPAGDDTGLMGVSVKDGAITWRDPVLRFPSLPLLDVSGDVIGSDGNSLVHYDADGKLMDSVIKLDPTMKPLFSLQLLGTDLIVFVSEDGQVALRETDGTPVTELFLHGNVQRLNGTFIPVASPISRDNRLYLMTEFVPETVQPNMPYGLGLQRLYAIDFFNRMTDRAVIAWYVNFEREGKKTVMKPLKFVPRCLKCELLKKIRGHSEILSPTLLWDYEAKMIFVSLTPPLLNQIPNAESTFWGLKDLGNSSALVFRTEQNVVNMALFEPNPDEAESLETSESSTNVNIFSTVNKHSMKPWDLPEVGAGAQLWVSLDDGKLCAVETDGNFSKVLDLPAILKTDLKITSKMVTVRDNKVSEDILAFGIKVNNSTSAFKSFLSSRGITQTNATAFLIAIDTPENAAQNEHPVAWMVPTPEDTIISGQIVGVQGDGDTPDQIVYFSQIEGKFARIVSVV